MDWEVVCDDQAGVRCSHGDVSGRVDGCRRVMEVWKRPCEAGMAGACDIKGHDFFFQSFLLTTNRAAFSFGERGKKNMCFFFNPCPRGPFLGSTFGFSLAPFVCVRVCL